MGKIILVNFIYNQLGNPVGFRHSNYLHTLLGQAIGQILDNHIYKLSGEYVGELYKDMIVDMNIPEPGNIGHKGDPGNPGSFGIPDNRGVIDTEYRDVFHKLLDRVNYIDESVNNFKYLVV